MAISKEDPGSKTPHKSAAATLITGSCEHKQREDKTCPSAGSQAFPAQAAAARLGPENLESLMIMRLGRGPHKSG